MSDIDILEVRTSPKFSYVTAKTINYVAIKRFFHPNSFSVTSNWRLMLRSYIENARGWYSAFMRRFLWRWYSMLIVYGNWKQYSSYSDQNTCSLSLRCGNKDVTVITINCVHLYARIFTLRILMGKIWHDYVK